MNMTYSVRIYVYGKEVSKTTFSGKHADKKGRKLIKQAQKSAGKRSDVTVWYDEAGDYSFSYDNKHVAYEGCWDI